MITNEWKNGQEDLSTVFEIRGKAMGETGANRDEYDDYAIHVILYADELPAGTGRLFHDGKEFRMDKLCVAPDFRGQHIGDLMARVLLYKSMEFAPRLTIEIPEKYREFYRKFGFREIKNTEGMALMQVKKEEIVFPSECGGHEKK